MMLAGGIAISQQAPPHDASSVIQIHGVGPFEITYVNAADDPRKPGN